MVDVSRSVESGARWPGAACWLGESGIALAGLIRPSSPPRRPPTTGQPPPRPPSPPPLPRLCAVGVEGATGQREDDAGDAGAPWLEGAAEPTGSIAASKQGRRGGWSSGVEWAPPSNGLPSPRFPGSLTGGASLVWPDHWGHTRHGKPRGHGEFGGRHAERRVCACGRAGPAQQIATMHTDNNAVRGIVRSSWQRALLTLCTL